MKIRVGDVVTWRHGLFRKRGKVIRVYDTFTAVQTKKAIAVFSKEERHKLRLKRKK